MFEVKRKSNQAQISREATTAARLGYPQHKSETRLNSSATAPVLVPQSDRNCQTRTPVITGEINYKGMLPIDGVLTGNLGASGGTLVLKQKTASCFASGPELSGEISFRDMLREGCRNRAVVHLGCYPWHDRLALGQVRGLRGASSAS